MRRVLRRRHSLLPGLLLVGIMLCTPGPSQAAAEKQVNVVFRFDDYSALSSTEIELRIIEAFRQKRAALTFGVIPFAAAGAVPDASPQALVPLTAVKGEILKAAAKDGVVDVALHGYSHQAINALTQSEFSGLDYNSQVEKLAKGKKLLEAMTGVPVTIFVPPWNSYDLNTLSALETLKFSTLSAAVEGQVMKNSRLNFLPGTCDLLQLRDAISAAQSSAATQPLIVVVFHAYDFREVDGKRGRMTFQEFSALLDWLNSRGNVRLLSIRQATQVINDLSADRFRVNSSSQTAWYLLPASVRKGEENLYADSAQWLWFGVGLFHLTIVALVTLTSFLLGRFVLPKSPVVMKIAPYGSTALAIVLLIYTFHDLDVFFRGMTICSIAVGAALGTWLCIRYLRKQRILTVDK